MPLTITKKDGKFCVTDPAGKEFGCHASKKEAVDQIGAIESSKAKSGLDLAADERIRILAAGLGEENGMPPIVIASDGTPEGTHLAVKGQMVPFKRVSLSCSNDPDYPYCDLHVTMEVSDDDGLVVEKSLTLRKEPKSD